jgi:hypothetical protein
MYLLNVGNVAHNHAAQQSKSRINIINYLPREPKVSKIKKHWSNKEVL